MTDSPFPYDPTAPLLTVNNRLAADLRQRHDAAQRAAGARVWESPPILPWDSWLTLQYQRLVDNGGTDLDLLSASQERQLWHGVIEHSEPAVSLLRPAAAAAMAQESARLFADWQLNKQSLTQRAGSETLLFLDWLDQIERLLARQHQLTRAHLLALLTTAINEGRLDAPDSIQLAGFDRLSPAQQAMLDALGARGCDIDILTTNGSPGRCQRITASDPIAEIQFAANWARQVTTSDPSSTVAIVVPQLQQLKHDIQRLFTATLAPHAYTHYRATQNSFNISLGEALADRPLVAQALLLLELLRGEHPLARIGRMLRSPFVGGHADEWEQRASLDAALREDGLPQISLLRLRFRTRQYATPDPRHCPDLLARIEQVMALLQSLPKQNTPHAWAGHLQRALHLFGWPGDAPLDSHEYQQHERLLRVFSELATFGKVRKQLRLGEAVTLLRTLTQETVFQPSSPSTRIQILGPLEAAGLRFDAIWMLGIHDQCWPAPPRPHPLLPYSIQRELDMPQATAERQLAFATELNARLVQCAPLVIASHASADGDQTLRPSPLINAWPTLDESDIETLANTPPYIHLNESPALEPMPTAKATPAKSSQAGGAGLLGAQANCPFQAVAQFRLDAKPLAEPTFSADGQLNGMLLHELLHRVWQGLQDSTTLQQHSAETLRQLVAELAKATVDDIGRRRPDIYTERFRVIEVQRLTRLVCEWLATEGSRTQAFRVSTLERGRSIELNGLSLRTRADRIDELADGSLAIIDYKTAQNVSHSGWLDERLSEPQLPLYCLDNPAPVSAVVLGRVRDDRRGCRYIGLSRDADFAPGVQSANEEVDLDWSQLLAHWQQALGELASEVMHGRAEPTPSPQACQYCPFGALCRVRETSHGR